MLNSDLHARYGFVRTQSQLCLFFVKTLLILKLHARCGFVCT